MSTWITNSNLPIQWDATGTDGSIGFLAWWNIAAKRVEPQWGDIESFVTRERYSRKVLPTRPTKLRTFKHVVQTFSGFGETKDKIRTVKIKEDGNVAVYRLEVVTPRASGDDLVYDAEPLIVDRLAFRKQQQDIRTDKGHFYTGRVLKEVNRLYGLCDANDVRHAVVGCLRQMGGFPVRLSGGVFYVPAGAQDWLQRLAEAVQGWGNSTLLIAPQYEAARGALAQSATAFLWQQVDEAQAELKELISADGTRQGTMHKRMVAFAGLKERVDYYSQAIGFQANGLVADIEALEDQIAAHLG